MIISALVEHFLLRLYKYDSALILCVHMHIICDLANLHADLTRHPKIAATPIWLKVLRWFTVPMHSWNNVRLIRFNRNKDIVFLLLTFVFLFKTWRLQYPQCNLTVNSILVGVGWVTLDAANVAFSRDERATEVSIPSNSTSPIFFSLSTFRPNWRWLKWHHFTYFTRLPLDTLKALYNGFSPQAPHLEPHFDVYDQ